METSHFFYFIPVLFSSIYMSSYNPHVMCIIHIKDYNFLPQVQCIFKNELWDVKPVSACLVCEMEK